MQGDETILKKKQFLEKDSIIKKRKTYTNYFLVEKKN